MSGLKSYRLTPKDVNSIVLIHLNWDHCLNTDIFENSEILVGGKEYEIGTLSGIRDSLSSKFRELLGSLQVKLVNEWYKPSPNSLILDTPCHISLVVNDGSETIVIAGDAVPNLCAYDRGVPDLIFYDLDLAMKSIERIKSLNADVIYPGHDPPFSAKGYLENDTMNIILRNRDESNVIVDIFKKIAEKPVVIRNA